MLNRHTAPERVAGTWAPMLYRMIDADYVVVIREDALPDELIAAAETVRAEDGLRIGLAALPTGEPIDHAMGKMLMGAKSVAVVEDQDDSTLSANEIHTALEALDPATPRLYSVVRCGSDGQGVAERTLATQLRNVVFCMAEAGPPIIRLGADGRAEFQ